MPPDLYTRIRPPSPAARLTATGRPRSCAPAVVMAIHEIGTVGDVHCDGGCVMVVGMMEGGGGAGCRQVRTLPERAWMRAVRLVGSISSFCCM